MGGTRSTASDWDSYHHTATKGGTAPISAAFTSRGMDGDLDPKGIVVREARDSAANPNSTPIVIGLDVTGSMGRLAHLIADKGLKTLFMSIYDRKPVPDPAIAFMGIGDAAARDQSPLQVSQFESSIVLGDQLTKLHIEGGGGGNNSESYTLPWYFAAMKVSADAIEKRGQKGFLFTVGDEECPAVVTAHEFEKVFGPGQWRDMTRDQLLEMASRNWHVFHVVVAEGSYARGIGVDGLMARWTDVLGQKVLRLDDHTKLAEVIVSAIEVTQGASAAAVAASWGGDTSLVVAKAVGGLTTASSGGLPAVVDF